MKRWYLLPLFLFTLLLASCDKENGADPLPYKRTVLVYLAADNNLSSFALQDLAEMKEGMAQVADGTLHLLVYIDTGSSPRLVELKKQNGQVVEDVVRTPWVWTKRARCLMPSLPIPIFRPRATA